VAACEQGSYDDATLAGYERRWKADIGRDLELGFRIFGLRQKMTHEEIDALVRALDDPQILSTIVQFGDMDRPGELVKKLMLNPGIIRHLGPLLSSGIRSFFR